MLIDTIVILHSTTFHTKTSSNKRFKGGEHQEFHSTYVFNIHSFLNLMLILNPEDFEGQKRAFMWRSVFFSLTQNLKLRRRSLARFMFIQEIFSPLFLLR